MTMLTQAKVVQVHVRKCGTRKKGGIYLVSRPGERGQEGVLPWWVTLNPPIPCEKKHHRGAIVVDGEAVLSREPERTWLAGASLDRAEKQDGDAWYIHRFGMSAHKRMTTGACEGAASIEQAYEILLGKVQFQSGLVPVMRHLGKSDIGEISAPVAAAYASLVKSLQVLKRARDVNHFSHLLVLVVGAVWNLANSLPPSRRSEFSKPLTDLMVNLGVPEDALEIRDHLS